MISPTETLSPPNPMATIKTRRRADGTSRHTAIVRIRKGKKVVHQESKTFSHVSAAKTWARHREVVLESPDELRRAQEEAKMHGVDKYKLKNVIRWYIDSFQEIANWGRTKQTTLEFLERHPIGDEDARQLTTPKLVQHIQARRAGGAGASTAGNDLIWIGVVLRAAKSAAGMRVNPEAVHEAQTACRELRLIGRSKQRDRRPSATEKERLREYFLRKEKRSSVPMADIIEFAFESSKRVAEICRLMWSDNDPATRTGVVRDAKHPTSKEGNHKRFKYTPEAWAIVQRQPRVSDRIFPYNPKTVGGYFTGACKVLGIVDLRFHDSRHEGTSRLFERGYQIHEVALVTLHESWDTLKRYTNLKPEDLRDIATKLDSSTHRRSRRKVTASIKRPSDVCGSALTSTSTPTRPSTVRGNDIAAIKAGFSG